MRLSAVPAMQLFVRDLAGQTAVIAAEAEEEVANLKKHIAEVHGIPADEQRLIFGGRSLEGSEKVSACGLQDESTLFVSLDFLGGGKKRKKKTYTKPKKLKHELHFFA